MARLVAGFCAAFKLNNEVKTVLSHSRGESIKVNCHVMSAGTTNDEAMPNRVVKWMVVSHVEIDTGSIYEQSKHEPQAAKKMKSIEQGNGAKKTDGRDNKI